MIFKSVCAVVCASLLFVLPRGTFAAANYRPLSLDNGSLELIARAVCVEGEGKSYLAKACIASMILNRMTDETLSRGAGETVYERGAFLRAKRERIDSKLPEGALDECISLVKLVYYFGIDPTCGAIFCFYDGDDDADSFNVTIAVDGLVFAKP